MGVDASKEYNRSKEVLTVFLDFKVAVHTCSNEINYGAKLSTMIIGITWLSPISFIFMQFSVETLPNRFLPQT